MAGENYLQNPMYVGNEGTDYQWIGNKLVNTNDVNGLKSYMSIPSTNVGVTPVTPYKPIANGLANMYASDGLGDYGTYTNAVGEKIGLNKEAFDSIANSGVTNGLQVNDNSLSGRVSSLFTPTGANGASLGGNIMDAFGKGVGAATGLASMYYANKNFGLQKENQTYEKSKDAQRDRNIAQFTKNVGGGASYSTL